MAEQNDATPVSEAELQRLRFEFSNRVSARHEELMVEALAEIKATVDGESDQPVKDIVYGLLDEIKALPDHRAALAKPASSPAGVREVAAQAALARIKNLRDQYADQAKFADVDEARLFRQFVERLDRAALSQSTSAGRGE